MNTRSDKSVFLFTAEFPYGNAESSFLCSEIPILAKRFSKVYLVPFTNTGKAINYQFDENVIVLNYCTNSIGKHARIKHIISGIHILIAEILCKHGLRIINNFRYHISQSMKYSAIAEMLYSNLVRVNLTPKDILYTYWFDEWTSVICLLKKKSLIQNTIISRAHGFDLYDYRNRLKYIFPRNFQFEHITLVYSISINGQNYLKGQYPKYSHKVAYSPLGTVTRESNLDLVEKPAMIRIVSCSSVIELKRIHKIVEILEHSTKQIEWVHFGDGPLLNNTKELCKRLPNNVSVIFKGQVENLKIIEYYQNNYINFFINVSEFEGVPVSIMEAISFGIPVIATDVGGVKEIVNQITGTLLPADFEPNEVCRLIESKVYSIAEKEAIKDFCKANYSANKNYSKFTDYLISTN